MKTFIPIDHKERERALNPGQSFIVQAPAGSGKTELLTQRYLKLLSLVEEPEEILAITFTRKAAAEMRNRIISSIIMAESSPRPQEAHSARTYDLASEALRHDRKMGWNILENPARLKIRTIDSFCLYLTGRMPVLSRMGTEVRVAEDPDSLYEEAARNTLLEINRDSRWREPLATILLHLDNDWAKVKNLIMIMLKLREHWLRLISASSRDEDLKELLEGHLRLEVTRRLKKTYDLFSEYLSSEQLNTFVQCASYAAANIPSDKSDSKITRLEGLQDLPDPSLSHTDKWLGTRELFLTRQGEWRKRFDKNAGFPPAGGRKHRDIENIAQLRKDQMQQLIASLSKHAGLKESLSELSTLPDTEYVDETWRILSALLQVLIMATGQLKLVMQGKSRVDYPEISMAALHALGQPDNPSELLLRLDYQIKHILFDEFQDTSISQHEMLSILVSGWEHGDGRTIFAVGDPMQSIYGFRDADVGVFLKTRQSGIGDLHLEPLNLSVNFRSDQNVVEWVNKVFPDVFQLKEDYVSGSVKYSAMSASRTSRGLVQVYPIIESGPEKEHELVLRIINNTMQEYPQDNIAILVRSRTHLTEIVEHLHRKHIPFQAVEIDPLTERPVVSDLLSLTRALLNPGDNLAWLCILRAPWCGVDLMDLSRISFPGNEKTVLEMLRNIEDIQGLSQEGGARLKKMASILLPAWENRQRRPLSRLVEGVWTALGGPACLEERQEMDDALAFLDHLAGYEQNQTIEDIPAFEKSLQALFSRPDPNADGLLQIMTIHKAKGLEFDTVILPGLEKTPPGSEKLLLQFMETPSEDKEKSSARLLLAPISSYGTDNHPTYTYINKLKSTKQQHEIGRLMYVAVTRARKRLHLLSAASIKQEDTGRTTLSVPQKRSLSFSLWHYLEQEFQTSGLAAAQEQSDQEPANHNRTNLLRRLSLDWNLPQFGRYSFAVTDEQALHEPNQEPVTYHWAGDTIRNIGICVHDLLDRIATEGLQQWDQARCDDMAEHTKTALIRLGVSRHDLDFASQKVMQAVKNTLSHETGRWILSSHQEARCEYPLSAVLDGRTIQVVIDRTFIDANEARWIIDFKTSSHEGGGLDDFLDREVERYQNQLLKYMRIFRMVDNRTVRAGLYFPLLMAWREVEG